MRRGLLLLGHGSVRNPASSASILIHAERLKAAGRYHQVRVAFWKEEPPLARGLDGFDTDVVAIVPVFVSRGYFTEQVIPRELRIRGRAGRLDGRMVVLTPPVGSDPRLGTVIGRRALEAGGDGSSSVVVLGHGTIRNPNSAAHVYAQAERVRDAGLFAEVVVLFLDQEPGLATVWSATSRSTVVVVPLFMSDGWHVGQTIPADLNLTRDAHRRGGRRLIYGAPVGTHPHVTEIIDDLAWAVLGELGAGL